MHDGGDGWMGVVAVLSNIAPDRVVSALLPRTPTGGVSGFTLATSVADDLLASEFDPGEVLAADAQWTRIA